MEFLLAFMPILLLFLGLVQLGLLYSGNLVVQHAAHRAVRAGVVALDDDPRYYDGEERMTVDGSRATAGDLETLVVGLEDGTGSTGRTLSRRATIELAAMTVLSSIEPRDGDSIADALGSMDASRRATAVRANTNLDIRIDRASGSADAPPRVRVRLTYGFACRVPVVRAWICDGGRRIIEADDWGAVQVGDMFYREGDWGAP